MKLLLALLIACTCVATARAQSLPFAINGYELISIYAPVRSSVVTALVLAKFVGESRNAGS
jgi:hypothetical protein